MRRYKKKNSFKFFLFVFIFVMVLGYALLSTNLNITGMVNLRHQNFSIHWVPNSIEVNDKSISQEEPILSDDNTTISYTINLKQPGDFYEFLIDATNDGTIDGMIELDGLDPVVKDENDEVIELPSYLKYSVTYSDGSDIEKYHLLGVGKTEHYKVRVEFDKDVDIDDLPNGSGQIHIDTTIPYEQADDNAYEREPLSNLTMLQTGPEVNAKLKRLAGNTEITPEMVDRALYLVNFVYKYLNSYGIIELPDGMTQEEWQEMQNAAGDISSKIMDTNVTSIEFADTLPSEYETEDNIISTSTSKEPVYAWYDNGVIYIYSEAEEIYMNQNSSGLFNVFQNVSNINLTRFNTSKVVNMSDMFMGDGGLPRLDVSNFNTNKVTNMSYMFGVCQSMTSLDLSNFNTSKVTDMSGMFFYNQHLLDLNISSFNTSKVTDMSAMFTYDSSLQSIDLSNFNTSKVTNMRSMFSSCLSLRNLDLSSFNTSNVEDMYGMFLYDQYLADIEFGNNFNTSKVTNMKFMFGMCKLLTSLDVGEFDTSNVRTMYGMFSECASLQTLNVKSFNTSKVEDMSGVFSGCANLTGLDLTRWDTSNTTTMYSMFAGCSNIVTLDLSSFDTSKVTNMANMFYSCDKLRTVYVSDDFITTNVTDSTNMFTNSTNIVGGQGTVYNSEHIDKEYAHIDGGVDNPGYFTGKSEYCVTLDANGGTVTPSMINIVLGEEIGTLPTPTREHYSFDGWYTELIGGIKIDSTYIPTNHQIFYAHWIEDDHYIITFNGNEGRVNEDYRKVYVGEEIGTLPSASRSGYTLEGWYTEISDGVKVESTYIPDENIELYARWEKSKYTITFNPNGGTVSPTSKQIYQGDAIGELPTPTRTGYTFNGWYTSSSGGTKITEETIPTYNRTYYAHWTQTPKYTVTFNPNGGTVTPTSRQVYKGNEVGELPTPTRDNYTFDGWFTASSGGDEVTASTIVTATVTYYAHWIENPKYTVTFNANGGTVSPESKQIYQGNEIGELPTPTRTDYTFDGWHIDVTDYIDIDSSYIPNSDLTLYAKWYPTDKVAEINGTYYNTLQLAFNAVPTTGEITTIRLLKSTTEKATLAAGKNAVLNLRGFTVNNTSDNTIVVNGTLKMNGGIITCSAGKGAIDVTGTLELDNVTIEATGSRQALYNNGGTVTINNCNLTSSATQRAALHNLNNGTIYINSGTITSTNLYAIYNESGTINIGKKDGIIDTNIITVQGKTYGIVANNKYNFYDGTIKGGTYHVGTATTGTTPTVANDTNETKINEIETNSEKLLGTETIGSTTYKTLKLQAIIPKYTVTFNPNGGSVDPTSKKIDIGSQVGELPTPTWENHTFDGWWTDLTSGVPVTSETVPEGNVTYYAHWTEIIDECTAFRNDSWTTILNNVDNDPTTYPVGCTKEVDLGSTYGTHTLRVANNTTPAACSTQGFSQSACGFVLEFADVITRHRMNSSVEGDTTTIGVNANGGWEYSDMRAYLNSTTYAYENIDYTSAGIYNALPSELRSKIIDTTVVSGHNMHDSTNFTTTDKLYLLSTKEVYGKEGTTNVVTTDTAEVETRQLDYYKSKGATTTNVSDVIKQNLSGANYEWWLRSANSYSVDAFGVIDYGNFFFYVGREGNHFYEFSNYTYGVSPAFRIGKTYNVTFNANDGYVSEGSRTINKGDSIGTLPTPTRPGYDFIGWYTGVTDGTEISSSMVPTGNVTYYAHWTYACEQFENDSWTTVMNNIISNPNTYPLGCEKPVDMENLGTHYLRISNTSTASGCNVSGFSQTACGVVFEFADAFDSRRMNPGPSSSQQNGEGNKGGWEYSELRSYVNSTVYNALPDVIKNRILPTSVISGHGSDDSANFVTQDKLYFLSMKEIWGVNSTEYASLPNDSVGATRQLDYYEMKGTSISDPSPASKSFSYWLRSADLNSSRFFITSSNAGVPWGSYAEYNSYISPAFRVGNKYTIDFNANGGEVSPTSKEIVAGNSIGDMPTPTRTGYVFEGWYIDIVSGLRIDESYIPDSNITLYAKWRKLNSEFDTGSNVSQKLKKLANPANSYNGSDTNIISIKRSSIEPTSVNKGEDNIISSSTSDYPIYAWYDNGTIYWWSEDDMPLLNKNSGNLFSGFKSLSSVDLEDLDTSNVTDMHSMFNGCTTLTSLDLSGFDTSSVTDMHSMFYGCTKLTSLNISHFETNEVTDMSYMFRESGITNINLSMFNFEKVEKMEYMFFNCDNLETVNLGEVNNAAIVSTNNMFDNCDALEKVIARDLYLGSSSQHMFSNTHIYELDGVETWDSSKVTDMSFMFANSNILELDLSSFDTSNVTNMNGMFNNMQYLTTIYVGDGWNISNVTSSSVMFGDCDNIVGQNGTKYNRNYITKTYAKIDMPNNQGYLSQKNTIGDEYNVILNLNNKSENSDVVGFKILQGEQLGNLLEPVRVGYVFQGWYTGITDGIEIDSNTIPTSNVTYYAHWIPVDCNGFDTASWSTIASNISQNPQAYPIGCTKNVDLGEYGTHTIRVANNTSPDTCSSSGYSQTACGFVLEFTDIITTHRMDPYDESVSQIGNGNIGGWEHSEMRQFLNNSIYNLLPSDLKQLIDDTTVISGHESGVSSNYVTTDKLYLLSPTEVFGTEGTMNVVQNDSAKYLTRQLDYYKLSRNRTNSVVTGVKKYENDNAEWFFRTAESNSTKAFYMLFYDGNNFAINSPYEGGVSPAFKLKTSEAPVETHTNTDTTCGDNTPPTCTLNYVNVNSNGFTYSFSCTDDTQINRITSLFDHDPYNGQYNSRTFDTIGTVKNGTISNGGKTSTYTSQWTTDNSDPPDHNTCYYFSYGGEDSCGNWNVYHTNSCYQY